MDHKDGPLSVAAQTKREIRSDIGSLWISVAVASSLWGRQSSVIGSTSVIRILEKGRHKFVVTWFSTLWAELNMLE
jgi:hypothetical protein